MAYATVYVPYVYPRRPEESTDEDRPRRLRRRARFAVPALLLTAATTVALTGGAVRIAAAAGVVRPAASAPGASASGERARTEQREFQLLDLINRDRIDNGLRPLRMQVRLRDYARHHAADEQARGTIWHDMAEYERWAPSGWTGLGEKVAYNSSVTAMHASYMRSPGHRANILDPEFDYVGVGITVARDGTIFNSEDFMTHPDSRLPTVSAGPAPTTPTTPTSLRAVAIGPGTVDLTWRPSTDDRGVMGYRIYLDGLPVATARRSPVRLTGVPPGSHVFTVRGYNAAGNLSPPSNRATTRCRKRSRSARCRQVGQVPGHAGFGRHAAPKPTRDRSA